MSRYGPCVDCEGCPVSAPFDTELRDSAFRMPLKRLVSETISILLRDKSADSHRECRRIARIRREAEIHAGLLDPRPASDAYGPSTHSEKT